VIGYVTRNDVRQAKRAAFQRNAGVRIANKVEGAVNRIG
jgi:hypothetical protein